MRLRDLAGRRVVIWGWGNEGRAARRVLEHHARPSSIVVVDDQDRASDDEVLRGAEAQAAVAAAEVIVKSPGVPPRALARLAKPVTGGTQLWFAETGGEHTIGVTGSKGKSTTTTLIAHLLEAVGESVVLAGNVGRALLDVLDTDLASVGAKAPADRWNALELSSFQCAEVEYSPQIAVLTALFPEHLDWHGSIDRYYADKINLFQHRSDIVTIVNADNPNVAARLAARSDELVNVITYGTVAGLHPEGPHIRDAAGTPIASLARCALIGHHNAVNACGALTVLRAVGVDLADPRVQAGIDSFQPLDYRLQPIGELDGRTVVDDGLSTAPDAAIAALAAYADRPVSILVGGHDRGLDYRELAAAIAARVQPTLVLGVPDSGARIVSLIEPSPIIHAESFADFDDAVAFAVRETPSGAVILLSPAAPSFGRFADYKARSDHFRELIGLADDS